MKERLIYLILEDNQVFEGKSFGAEIESIGELVFTTGMGGYIETLTDPSYYGQICIQTFPLIGNYGIIEEDFESPRCHMKGYIVRQICDFPSNFRCQYDLNTYLKNQGIPGICDIDTRHLTTIIREHGVMNAMISHNRPTKQMIEKIKIYKISDSVASVSSRKLEESYIPMPKNNVLLIDYGSKKNIIKELNKRYCNVTSLPHDAMVEEILDYKADGVMLSNGPGDPKDNIEAIQTIKKIVGKVPVFGICLGHQLLALAMGHDTVKLKYGHRGANQPVIDKKTNSVYITTQNHGYSVVAKESDMSFVNANDFTCEGMEYPHHLEFSSQFHPEACSGPKDASFLFDKFIKMMEVFRNAKR